SQMIAGLDCGRRHVPGQEEQSGKPEHAVDKCRDAFIKANAPLHPGPMDVAANMAVEGSAQDVKNARSSCQGWQEEIKADAKHQRDPPWSASAFDAIRRGGVNRRLSSLALRTRSTN